jgi:hypothetical protein
MDCVELINFLLIYFVAVWAINSNYLIINCSGINLTWNKLLVLETLQQMKEDKLSADTLTSSD